MALRHPSDRMAVRQQQQRQWQHAAHSLQGVTALASAFAAAVRKGDLIRSSARWNTRHDTFGSRCVCKLTNNSLSVQFSQSYKRWSNWYSIWCRQICSYAFINGIATAASPCHTISCMCSRTYRDALWRLFWPLQVLFIESNWNICRLRHLLPSFQTLFAGRNS